MNVFGPPFKGGCSDSLLSPEGVSVFLRYRPGVTLQSSLRVRARGQEG